MYFSILSSNISLTHSQYSVSIGFNTFYGYRTQTVFISYSKRCNEWMAFPIIKGQVKYSVELAQVRIKSSLFIG